MRFPDAKVIRRCRDAPALSNGARTAIFLWDHVVTAGIRASVAEPWSGISHIPDIVASQQYLQSGRL
jgi:hypothetical protein